ncbi:hypothetical protein B566_EDAN002680 [Ephemera danica]|nr:hypothetical protein B566_EDAN002680 [Ephemera danica]
MNKLCRQVSIESPGPTIKDCVFSFEVPVPDVPANGARIRVACAGACYRLQRTPSLSSISSMSSVSSLSSELSQDLPMIHPQSPAHQGVKDGAIFPGFEVAGIVESLGAEVLSACGFKLGDRVVIYPYEGVPHGVAAMLPTGALLAMNTVEHTREYVEQLFQERGENAMCKILIVGTGGLALWAIRIANHNFSSIQNRVSLTVATLRDEGFLLAKENQKVNLVQWNEDLYEKQLIERTTDACKGEVDIGGVVFISSEVAERLMPKFSRRAEERHQRIKPVNMGTIEQLQQLVQLVSSGEIEPPPHAVFPAEEASEVVKKLCHSEIHGRAILQFFAVD